MSTIGTIEATKPTKRYPSVSVREACRADISELAALKHEVASRAYSELVSPESLTKWLDGSCTEKYFQYRIGRSGYHIFVAEDEDGNIVGYTGFRQRGNRADVHSVGMYVKHSEQGVGTTLHRVQKDAARQLGCDLMRVACWRPNEKSIRFSEGKGFKKTGTGFRDGAAGVRVDHYEREIA